MKIGSSVALGNTLKINNLVEAAGVEPAPPQNANWLMARDFRLSLLEIRCHVVDSLCSGVLPSPGDMLVLDVMIPLDPKGRQGADPDRGGITPPHRRGGERPRLNLALEPRRGLLRQNPVV